MRWSWPKKPSVTPLAVVALGGCFDEWFVVPEQAEPPKPFQLAELPLPEGTPCAEGLKALYAGNCSGQEEQPICKTFVAAVKAFSIPEEGLHCDPDKLAIAQQMGLRFSHRAQSRAPPTLQQQPHIANRVNDQRLFMLEGFNRGVIENAAPRLGQEAAAQALRASYKPASFAEPLPR